MSAVSSKVVGVFMALIMTMMARHPQPMVLQKSAEVEKKVPELCPEKGRRPFIANGKPFHGRFGHPVQVPLRHRCPKT